jgi:hypothetical protein
MDQWDEYIRRMQENQPAPTSDSSSSIPFASLFSLLSGTGQSGSSGIQPNAQGMYTPSAMANGAMQPGPPTPINYAAIRNLLNSGVLRTGSVTPMPAPTPTPVPAPAPTAGGDNPLARIFSLFGGAR